MNSYVLHKFCYACGAKQLPDECPHCLAGVDSNYTYCPECGKPLRAEFETPEEEKPKRKLKPWYPRLHSRHFAWIDRLCREDERRFDDWLDERLSQGEFPELPKRVGGKGLPPGFSNQSTRISDEMRRLLTDNGGILLLRVLIDKELQNP